MLTQTLEGLVSNPAAFPEVIWSFYQKSPVVGDHVRRVLGPGIDRNRVTFYSGIDCRTFLPKLAAEWRRRQTIQPDIQPVANRASGQAIFRSRLPLLAKLDCDRPPNIETWVGRDDEIGILEDSSANFVAICGIGGQGKSVLAARYLKAVSEGTARFDYWDWRDCKEESDRIRSQIVAAIERVSEGTILPAQLAEATELDLVEVFVRQSMDRRVVFVSTTWTTTLISSAIRSWACWMS